MTNTDIEKQGNYIWAPAAREEAIAYGPDWRTLVLQDRCVWDITNSSLFPRTTELVKRFKVPSVEVFFARQSPQTGIEPHSDNTNFILTSHLGLDVPEGECWMRVGNEQHFGKMVLELLQTQVSSTVPKIYQRKRIVMYSSFDSGIQDYQRQNVML